MNGTEGGPEDGPEDDPADDEVDERAQRAAEIREQIEELRQGGLPPPSNPKEFIDQLTVEPDETDKTDDEATDGSG